MASTEFLDGIISASDDDIAVADISAAMQTCREELS